MIKLIIVSFDSHKLAFKIYGTTGFQTNCNKYAECLCFREFFLWRTIIQILKFKIHEYEFN